MKPSESFRPRPNLNPKNNRFGLVLAYVRRLIDFQTATIYNDLYGYAKTVDGVVLDLGCGDCPYKHLFGSNVIYKAMDTIDAENFDYGGSDIIKFDGKTIPLENESVNHILCSEVFEHVLNPEQLIQEIKRVLKVGGDAFITIPWSARYHYIPYDYARYTPSKIKDLFHDFEISAIKPRGTDIAVICNKVIVIFARQFYPQHKLTYLRLPFTILLMPILALAIMLGNLSIFLRFGSTDDPLGYTILVKKK